MSASEKDLEIMILRYQLAAVDRQAQKSVKLNRVEKVTLTVLATKLKTITGRPVKSFNTLIRLVQPETLFRWHRELVRRKWTYKRHSRRGRPTVDADTERLIVRLANENPRWGYKRIQGELLKVGLKLSVTTVRNVLKRNGILPAPVRHGSLGWKTLMAHYKDQLLADLPNEVILVEAQASASGLTLYDSGLIEATDLSIYLPILPKE